MTPETVSLAELTETPHERLFTDSEPSVVRLALAAGESVPEHTHPERTVVLHLLSGRVDLSLDGEVHELEAGDVVRFDGRRDVSPTAVEDSEALLVLSRRVD